MVSSLSLIAYNTIMAHYDADLDGRRPSHRPTSHVVTISKVGTDERNQTALLPIIVKICAPLPIYKTMYLIEPYRLSS